MSSHTASTPPARITLSMCEAAEITAIATGEQYRWAHTALAAAGWERTANGVHTRLFGDRAAAERAVSTLVHFARRHRTAVVTSTRPHLGDIAGAIAHQLPGPWTPTIEVYSNPVWQQDLVPWLWDSGELTRAVQAGQVTHAAKLTNQAAGIDLLLIERPGHSSGYVIGAFAPDGFDDNYEGPYSPAGAVLPQDPYRAAAEIADRYLPGYQQALHARRTAAVAYALSRIRDERTELQHLTATGPDPAHTERFADVAWYEVLDIVKHAPPLIERCRRSPLPLENSTAITRLEVALGTGTTIVNGWHSLLTGTPDAPRAYRAEHFPEAKATRNRAIHPVIDTWLAHGDTLLRHAAPAAPGRAPVLAPAAVPALPPAASTPARPR
ncbi:hypothetical protein GCM10010232_50070 [Streptomyces amakusaensis]|uniref:Uncharacterized protein n=1 Tax=Streptomyces amakusaensis TaxID=67271 RepID=A0ABW0APQ0_9ACTN